MSDAAVSRARGKTFSTRAATQVAVETRICGGKPVSLARLAPPARTIPEGERRAIARPADWTPEMLADLRRMRADGWMMPRIARLLGVGQETARTKCLTLGLPRRAAGVRGFSPAEDALLREMLAAGVALAAVAEELGRALTIVTARAAALGLSEGSSRIMSTEGEGRHWADAAESCDAHLADLRRAGHDPRATELRIGAEGGVRWRGPAAAPLFSGCGSPAAACAGD